MLKCQNLALWDWSSCREPKSQESSAFLMMVVAHQQQCQAVEATRRARGASTIAGFKSGEKRSFFGCATTIRTHPSSTSQSIQNLWLGQRFFFLQSANLPNQVLLLFSTSAPTTPLTTKSDSSISFVLLCITEVVNSSPYLSMNLFPGWWYEVSR